MPVAVSLIVSLLVQWEQHFIIHKNNNTTADLFYDLLTTLYKFQGPIRIYFPKDFP